MQTPYKSRVQAVRSAAQTRLMQLRTERLARSRHATLPERGDSASSPVRAQEGTPVGQHRPDAAPIPQITVSREAIDAMRAACEQPQDAPLPALPPAPPSAPLLAPSSCAGPAVASAGTDLVALPGIGPGLIWLLGRAGIVSLADLSRADPPALEARLGLIGQLIDVPGWVDAASALAGAQAEAVADAPADAADRMRRQTLG